MHTCVSTVPYLRSGLSTCCGEWPLFDSFVVCARISFKGYLLFMELFELPKLFF